MRVLSDAEGAEVDGGALFGRLLGLVCGVVVGGIASGGTPVGIIVGGAAGAYWGDTIQDRINGEGLPQK